jgi:tRNA A-37 threonylcarbamoyl transferase component Bud32
VSGNHSTARQPVARSRPALWVTAGPAAGTLTQNVPHTLFAQSLYILLRDRASWRYAAPSMIQGPPPGGGSPLNSSVETPDATGLIAGRFEVVRTLGDGAFAVVYEAIDRELGRRVALKLFNRYAPDELDLALREARAMAWINHANVLAVHDIGEHRGTPFLALEYAETDLHRWLSAGVRDPDKILALLIDAGRGLAAAHSAGLVHHDFKPANVMLRSDGSVAVGDFGLARHLDSQDDESGESRPNECALGTLRYISPERLLGCVGDPRSDQFSFCVALWEALCGMHPFAGLDAQRRYESIVAGPSGSPRAPAHIVRALRRGLSLEPEARFSDMDELLAALEQPGSSRSWWPPHVRQSSGSRRGKARGLRPALSFAALAGVFALSLIASRDAPADAGLPLAVLIADCGMDNARDLAFDDKPQLAIAMLMEVMPIVRQTDPAYQDRYLAQLEVLGDVLAESGAYPQATMAYAAGKNLARDLDVSPDTFIAKREVVQAKANRKNRATGTGTAGRAASDGRADSSSTPTRGK